MVETEKDGFQHQVGSKIFCFHGPLIYESKVLKAQMKQISGVQMPSYFVHYQGWKDKWDDWVPEDRTLVINEESIQKRKELIALHTNRKTPTAKVSEKRITAPEQNNSRKRKASVAAAADSVEDFSKSLEVRIAIPDELKTRLVLDWENVTSGQKLVPLPRDPTVAKILEDYRQVLKNTELSDQITAGIYEEVIIDQVVDGLKVYFDKCLGNMLLYRFERNQYVEIKQRNPDAAMSDIYGCEHLLRLFVQLPSLVAHTAMDTETVATLKEHFALLLKWILEHKDELFAGYENASAQYLDKIKVNA